jgi:hypothetical protein
VFNGVLLIVGMNRIRFAWVSDRFMGYKAYSLIGHHLNINLIKQ